MTNTDINKLLTSTQLLMNHVYWFQQDFSTKPSGKHTGSAINYTDIKERRDDFLTELINTVNSWVYSKAKVNQLIQDRVDSGDGLPGAYSHITSLARNKFRKGLPQGQFGELLLFNLIQHLFKAVPLLRKMPLTTSTGHERFGADAIHFKIEDGKNVFVIGESKCYESDYKFHAAFKASVNSIYESFENYDKELDLYVYDDFLEDELVEIAKAYKQGTLTNVSFELVSIIIYNEKKLISGENEADIKSSIESIIRERLSGTAALDCFDGKKDAIINRINYIVFPFWGLSEILEAFENKM